MAELDIINRFEEALLETGGIQDDAELQENLKSLCVQALFDSNVDSLEKSQDTILKNFALPAQQLFMNRVRDQSLTATSQPDHDALKTKLPSAISKATSKTCTLNRSSFSTKT